MFSKFVGYKQRILLVSLVTILAILWSIPLLSLLVASFGIHGLGNYLEVLRLKPFPYFFMNSIIISFSTLVIRLFVVSMAAYAFSRMRFPLKNLLFYVGIVGLFAPPFTLIVPLFQTVKSFNMLDSVIGVIFPLVSFGISFNLLLFKNYFDTIPEEVFEAADIDGATHWRKFISIILPLGRPIIITGGIFTFLNSWNEYLLPLIFIKTTEKYPITLSPYYFMAEYTADYAKVYAAMIIISIPIFIVYLLGQRYLERGLTTGAIK